METSTRFSPPSPTLVDKRILLYVELPLEFARIHLVVFALDVPPSAGEIPAELGRLSGLQDLQLSTNELTGVWATAALTKSVCCTLSVLTVWAFVKIYVNLSRRGCWLTGVGGREGYLTSAALKYSNVYILP